MRCQALLIVSLAVSLFAVSQVARPTKAENETSVASELGRLQQQVVKLEERVAKLEQRPTMVVPTATIPALRGQQVPESWTQREFNGQTYWIVPLDTPTGSQGKASSIAPQRK